MKDCAEIRGSSVASPRNHLLGYAESSFGHPRICLVGFLQTIFWRPQVIESAKSSSGVSEIVLWNCKSYINRCAISFERSTATLRGSFCRYVRRFHRYPAMFSSRIVCDDSAEDSQKSASCCVEFCRKPLRQIRGVP